MKPITPDDQPLIVPLKDPGWIWGKPLYKVVREWEWEWRGILILARVGYQFDAASVPRIFWVPFGYTPDGLHRAPSLAHDIGCERKGMLITGAAIGRPEFQCVLLGDPTVRIGQSTFAGQLAADEVHELWHDLLFAVEGSRPRKSALMAWGVATFGPRW